MRNPRHIYWLCLLLLSMLLGTGCFSIPFLGGGGPPENFEPRSAEFGRENVFVGYNGDSQPVVEIRLVSQEVSVEKGLTVNVRLFTTEHFKVVNIFRGLRSINYYPIERRFHRLELKYGRRGIKMKVSKNMQIKGDKPIDAMFEHTGTFTLLPDTVSSLKLKFQDVDRWDKMPADTLDEWYASKEQYFQRAERSRRRSSLVEIYRRRQKEDYTKTFIQYDSLFVTTNNAYVFLEKDVASDILYTVNAGDKLDYGVSDGVWVEVPTPEALREELMVFFESRRQNAIRKLEMQRQRARSSRGGAQPLEEIDTTLTFNGFMLDVMAQKRKERAIAWERGNMMQPVDVPLFAQVLSNRETAVIARRDSLAKARQDSVKAVEDSLTALAAAADSAAVAADSSVAAADSNAAAADSSLASVAAAATARDTAASTGSVAPPPAGAAPAPAAARPPQPAKAAADSSGGSPGERQRIVGPDGQVWDGKGRPPWAGRNDPELGPRPAQAPAPPAAEDTTGSGATAPDSSGGAAADSSAPASGGADR